MTPSPFSPQARHDAIAQALASSPLPPDKTVAVIATVTQDGVSALLAVRAGSHWILGADVEYHGGPLTYGAHVVASW